jgi:hypothetical protein
MVRRLGIVYGFDQEEAYRFMDYLKTQGLMVNSTHGPEDDASYSLSFRSTRSCPDCLSFDSTGQGATVVVSENSMLLKLIETFRKKQELKSL